MELGDGYTISLPKELTGGGGTLVTVLALVREECPICLDGELKDHLKLDFNYQGSMVCVCKCKICDGYVWYLRYLD
jgi:hypothetical protein